MNIHRLEIFSIILLSICTLIIPQLVLAAAPNTNFSENLQLWDTGSSVRTLQQFLNAQGFIITQSGPGSAGYETTMFGTHTYQALLQFQAAHGLPTTGFFGPLTRALANSSLSSPTSTTATSSVAVVPTPPAATSTVPTPIAPPIYKTPPPAPAMGQPWQGVSGGGGGGPPAPAPTPPAVDTTPPSSPTNLTAVASSSNNSEIDLSWIASTDNVGVTGYKVFRDASQISTSTQTNYADTGLTASTTYTYTVEAFDAEGNVSAASNIATSTTDSIIVASLAIPNYSPETVAVVGNTAYLAADPNGLTIVDVTNPAAPRILGTWEHAGLFQVAVAGNYVYVPNHASDTFTILDVSNPASPSIAGTLTDSRLGSMEGIVVNGNYAFILCSSNGGAANTNSIASINITDPTNPTFTGYLTDGTFLLNGQEMALSGNYLYTTASDYSTADGYLTAVDVSSSTNMTIAGHVALSDGPSEVMVSGDRAYVSLYASLDNTVGGLAVVDISTPTAPTVLGTIIDSFLLYLLVGDISDNKFIAAINNSPSPPGGIAAIDVSDPTNPTFITSFSDPTLDTADAVAISGNYAYVVSGFLGSGADTLDVLDLRGLH